MSQYIPILLRALPPLPRGGQGGWSRRQDQTQCEGAVKDDGPGMSNLFRKGGSRLVAAGTSDAVKDFRAVATERSAAAEWVERNIENPVVGCAGTTPPSPPLGKGGKLLRGQGAQQSAAQVGAQPRYRPRWSILSTAGLAAATLLSTAWAKVETWRQEGPTGFAKARREGVVISEHGRVRLGHSVSTFGTLSAERVWDLARDRSGTVYAATGDNGKVFRREPKADAPWTVAYDSSDSQALALVVGSDGAVYVGTGPTGQVVNITDPAHPASRPGPKVQYIWGLAADAHGNLYAATGPNGQLWKRARDGKWSLLYDSKATHLLCVALGPDGTVYAGSDGEGLVYRITALGKATILFDAPQSEIRTLLWAGDGALYAGTAAEAGGGSTTRSSMFLTQAGLPHSIDGPPSDRPDSGMPHRGDEGEPVRVSTAPADLLAQGRPTPRSTPGGSANPKPIAAGDNAVYRLDADGVPREVLRVKALIHALCWVEDRLLVGTGPEGQLYEVREQGHDTAPVAKLDHGQILSMLALPDHEIVMGTGDPGSVVRLAPGYAAEGLLVSEVHDTKLVSRFGTVSWQAELPPGTRAVLQARSGNVGEPDETWSPWSAELTEPGRAAGAVPPGRFIQYRVKLTSTDPLRTPDLRSVSVNYRTANLAPEISRLDVPDLSAGDGAARQTKLNIRWDTTDPNDDELNFTLKVRKDGWPEWIALTESPITEKSFAWDTTAFPSGTYRLKLFASDRPSNSPEESLGRDRESVAFLVDHEPPQVSAAPKGKSTVIVLNDALTRVVKADYAVDGGPWVPVFPDDGLFDSLREQITLSLPDLKPGPHLLMVRATDAAGNVGSVDALLQVGK